ncbi:MAG: ammonium transporter [Lewinellaceae bacterium]|nr:ammonium transporter [Saprospiraceae bacterium]MCB9337814.1 ammonium transporter [Lewinellaceae bacterium]
MNRPTNRYSIPFVIIAMVAVGGIFMSHPPAPSAEEVNAVNAGDVAWLLSASGLVLLMTPGLAFFYGGMVRYKNLISTLIQNFISLGIVSIAWLFVGFSFAFGDDIGGLIGNPATFFMFDGVGLSVRPEFAAHVPFALFAMFQLKFAIITPALITGGVAERIRFSSLMLFIVLFTLFIYSPLAHWTWHPGGFLRNWGVLDFAGGTVVHISAGFAALAGAMYLGKRDGQTGHHTPTNIPFVVIGTGLLWFGWFGFNAGSSLAADGLAITAFVNTNFASATAMLAWVLLDGVTGRKRSVVGACVGAVVGLVAITPAAGFVTVGQSVFIGFVATGVSYFAVRYKTKTGIDDTLDVFPCHGLGGIVGMILTAVFAKDVGLVYGHASTLMYHLLALVIVSIFTFGGSYLLFMLTDYMLPLRVSPKQESLGLDLAQHGETATDWKERVNGAPEHTPAVSK